ncbi:Protein M01F1.4 a [Aphelenchoides avenae]|nr:Protein M01F1.4 a [Aphelenchus avenae]
MADRSFVIDRIATSNEEKTALQFAFYNTLLFVLTGLCLVGIFAVYQILYMFLTPILWATLVGTVLFPLKRRISNVLKDWLNRLDEEDKPLVIGLALLPFEAIKNFSNATFNTFLSAKGVFIVVAYAVLKVLSYQRTFMVLLAWAGQLYNFVGSLIVMLTKKWVCLRSLRTLFVLAHISQFFGPFRVLMFVGSAVTLGLIAAGFVGANLNGDDEDGDSAEEATVEASDDKTADDVQTTTVVDDTPATTEVRRQVSVEQTRLDHALTGDTHLRIVGGLCILRWAVRHDSVLDLVLVPFLLALFAKLGQQIGVTDFVYSTAEGAWIFLRDHSQRLVNIVVAGSLRKFVKLLFTSDRMFVSGLMKKADLISSIAVMIILAFGTVFFVIFTAFQLHSETVHLVKLGGNIISSNPEWLRVAMNYTEGQLREHDVDEYVEKAYQQGRVWLASNARSLADPKDQTRGDQLEAQANMIVDNLYRLWEERSGQNSTCAAGEKAVAMRGDWMAQLMTASNLATLREEVTEMIKENIETVLSIAQSIWSIVMLNISFLSSIVLAFLSLILSFGSDILHFVIEVIVYLTAVYYLLANSIDQWLPLQWISQLTPFIQRSSVGAKPDVSTAIETAISGVFVLSAKMAIFYGSYTYFVHSLFDLNVIFVPSMVASIFAAIPIVPPYAVAIFGIVELYLVRGETAAAIVFGLANIAPLFFADAAFYSEIKGSHPYVTGLAVIGGMYWLGLQGAIIGPIVLCCVLVLINLYAEFAKR